MARGAARGYDPHYAEMNMGFVGSRAGFRRGAVAPLLPPENIAPMVAALLRLDCDPPDGALYPGLLIDC